MKNFDTPKLTNTGSMFNSVPDNVVVCINENNNNKIVELLKKKKCVNIDCSDNWQSKQKKIISDVNGCQCELDNCLACSSPDENKILCTTCKTNYYKI
jgi:hypothetical protein